jgi:8-oxo-dGTP pyrophosphatase MutT (NUDIX family)
MENRKSGWEMLSNKTTYENPWIRVEHHEVLNPNGQPGIYGKVHFKNIAVSVVPIDEEGNTYLVGQERYTIGQYSWELPEGGCLIESGESPLEAAKRELLEETGLIAATWTCLGEVFLSNSVTDEKAVIFLAQHLQQKIAQPEETEVLQLRKLPLQEAIDMAKKGEITDALSVISLLKVPGLHNR